MFCEAGAASKLPRRKISPFSMVTVKYSSCCQHNIFITFWLTHMLSNGTVSHTIWKNHREAIYLSTNVQQQTIFWAGVEGNLDDEGAHLSINPDSTVPSSFVVFRIDWRDISVFERVKNRKWDLEKSHLARCPEKVDFPPSGCRRTSCMESPHWPSRHFWSCTDWPLYRWRRRTRCSPGTWESWEVAAAEEKQTVKRCFMRFSLEHVTFIRAFSRCSLWSWKGSLPRKRPRRWASGPGGSSRWFLEGRAQSARSACSPWCLWPGSSLHLGRF